MSREAEQHADETIQKLRKLKGFCPMTPEEADIAFDAAPAEPISANEVESMIKLISSSGLSGIRQPPDSKSATKQKGSNNKVPMPISNESLISWTHPSVKLLATNGDPLVAMVTRAREVVLAAQDEGWKGPPFDPVALAQILRIPIEPCQDVRDARTVPIGKDKAKIEFNPNCPPARIRYSIAHEIAHTFFPDCSQQVRNRESREEIRGDLWQLEMLCNVGAAELLLPIGSMEPEDISYGVTNIDRLLELRRRFEVSTEAVLLRVVKLSLEPLIMFAASRIETKSGARYRIDYSQSSNGSPLRVKSGALLPKETLVSRCTASGFTERGEEHWPEVEYALHLECVGIPPYPGHAFPRVVGVGSLTDSYSIDVLRLDDLQGDALIPRSGSSTIIAHVVNDATPNWGGGGFASAVRRKFPSVAEDFQQWAQSRSNLRLGNSRLCEAVPNCFVFSMVAQKGYGASNKPRIRYEHLKQCLQQLAKEAKSRNAAVQMPRIGCGQAGGRWSVVRELIEEALLGAGVSTTIYRPPGEFGVRQPELFE